MLDAELFLVYPLDHSLFDQVQKSSLFSQFLNQEPANLRIIKMNEQSLIGKSLGSIIDTESLKLAEDNLFSFLVRILPKAALSNDSFELITITHE